ncbi:hypothetical protein CLV68_4440 [Actinokineospora cianjurensis]|uniref:Uncharacterized protein n=1 Tax=Actinokineospora cianjurensis TaxID=585224 RepID=A0A421B1X7_9PSEU|nr:hypothetical protein [Actinokineospora cianjurensis]RLK58342.1 hypothetical protein CLV68_4440 [Actinokineospora cianjurensis]
MAVEPGGFRWIGTRFILWSFLEIFRWPLPAPVLRLIATGDPAIRSRILALTNPANTP